MKLLVINGPNINMLGIREPEIYGSMSYDELCEYIRAERGITGCGDDAIGRCEIDFFQSNHEGAIVDEIQRAYFDAYDGIVINAAAYTHTSIAILDAIRSVPVPAVEVHLSEPMDREDYRHISYVGQAAIATVSGKGPDGYIEAIDILISC